MRPIDGREAAFALVLARKASMRCELTMAYGCTLVTPNAAPKKKRSLLPLLTVLFLFSYGLMTLLIIEQGSTIQAQSNLIRVLERDSSEFWAAKGKAIAQQRAAQANSAKAPSAQMQGAPNQTPKHQPGQAGPTAKPGIGIPPAPASDLLDHRRSLNSI
jgi:hypothetical protein